MALFWIALVVLVVFAVVKLFPGRTEPAAGPRERAEEPHEIVKRRLAKGEIDVDTYERLSSRLGSPSPAAKG
jgi:putative membrane protein